ncbi:MAG: ribosomal-processing cysteine protease Prp [Anaerorhabdus sp.]
MIQIIIQMKQDKVANLNIQGHAEYADHGKDIVCAGVSAVAVGLLNALDYFSSSCVCLMEKNEISVQVSDIEDTSAQIALMTAKIQLETIQESYKEYINITRQEV